MSQPGLGIAPETRAQLARKLDLVVNSSGLTDFNPDLREALASNVAPVLHLIEFLRASDHAGLMHLSTCYVVGAKDGRVAEEVQPNYTPLGVADFDAEHEWHSLQEVVAHAEARAESPEITAALRRQALGKHRGSEEPSGPELENLIRKNRMRWLRNRLTRAGTRRARRLGWPNTYTLTKSLAESMIVRHGAGLPIAIVRPSIVETSTDQPFRGWNEGINTSAPLSYLLGTYFRQLPTNERKCLDVIPVDMVCRGMTLIAAAIIARRHEADLSAGHVREQSVRHGTLDRTDRPRAPQTLSLAAESGELDAHAVRHDSRLQIALREIFRSRAKSRGPGHQSRRFGAADEEAAAGPPGTRPRSRRKTDRALRAVYLAQRAGVRSRKCAVAFRGASSGDERAAFGYDPSAD